MAASSQPPPHNPISKLNSVRATGRRYRVEWLISLGSGMVSLPDLIDQARTPAGGALRAIPVTELLLAQPDWSASRAATAVVTLRRLTRAAQHLADRQLTVGWLIDPRTRDQRLAAFADVLVANTRISPQPTFPYPSTRS